ncbi:MAG: hypothetical protein NTW09_01770 [Candidatus Omnitrophica bacterium]|nr:hypothetical protein [Candidatus Omnitrophota bacterium]
MIKGKLKLPVGKFPEHDKWLSMDDYIKFINFTSTYFRRKRTKKDELAMRVNVPFSIK